MQVVILAAGRGTRLPGEVPKILRMARGSTLFRHALEQALEVTKTPIVVCQKNTKQRLRETVPTRLRTTKFSSVDYVQQGAAMSLLAATGRLKDDEPVMVMDCDTIFAKGVLHRFAAFSKRAFALGKNSTILTFVPTDNSSRYSFAGVDTTEDTEFPHVYTVAEKQRISMFATCGVHAFSKWSILRQAIFEMVILGVMTNNEYYVSPVHNTIVGTTAMLIEASEFNHVGTTDELEAYEQAVSKA